MAPFTLSRAKAVRFESSDMLNIDQNNRYETEKPKKGSKWRFKRKEIAVERKEAIVEENKQGIEVVWRIPAVAAVMNLGSSEERMSEYPPSHITPAGA